MLIKGIIYKIVFGLYFEIIWNWIWNNSKMKSKIFYT
jgi:hypothetical protein